MLSRQNVWTLMLVLGLMKTSKSHLNMFFLLILTCWVRKTHNLEKVFTPLFTTVLCYKWLEEKILERLACATFYSVLKFTALFLPTIWCYFAQWKAREISKQIVHMPVGLLFLPSNVKITRLTEKKNRELYQ